MTDKQAERRDTQRTQSHGARSQRKIRTKQFETNAGHTSSAPQGNCIKKQFPPLTPKKIMKLVLKEDKCFIYVLCVNLPIHIDLFILFLFFIIY